MRALILTEDSPTTTDDRSTDQLIDHYEGAFGSVRRFVDALPAGYETTFLIYSEDHGCLEGSDDLAALERQVSEEEAIEEMQAALSDALAGANLVFISLTKTHFDEILADIWDELITKTGSDTLWGLAGARSSLDSVDLASLRDTAGGVVTTRGRASPALARTPARNC